jgi:hypothetical protein
MLRLYVRTGTLYFVHVFVINDEGRSVVCPSYTAAILAELRVISDLFSERLVELLLRNIHL